MTFQPSMFLYNSRAQDAHWSAGCSRALLAASNSNRSLSDQQQSISSAVAATAMDQQQAQLASALLLNQHREAARLLADACKQSHHEAMALAANEEHSNDMEDGAEPEEDEFENEDDESDDMDAEFVEDFGEQETALNLSLSSKKRGQDNNSHNMAELQIFSKNENKYSQQIISNNIKNNSINFDNLRNNQTLANQSFIRAANLIAAAHQQQQQQLHNEHHDQNNNTYKRKNTSNGQQGGTSSLLASSTASSSSSSSSSSSGWSSAADSLACSPERAASLSSPVSSTASQQSNKYTQQPQAHRSIINNNNHHQHNHNNSNTNSNHHLQNSHQDINQDIHRPLFIHHHSSHHHHHHHDGLGPVHKADSDDLDRIRNFIEQFKARRGALGLTQKQAAQCFRAYTNDRYAFSDNFVGHFEGFQFRPQTAMTIADSLAEWLEFAENETRSGRQLDFMPGKVKETRKRKYEVIRIRDSAKRVLVEAFEKNKSPSTSELEQLSRKTNIPSRNIEIFFKNRRTSRQYHQ